jgi:hypothetical protein
MPDLTAILASARLQRSARAKTGYEGVYIGSGGAFLARGPASAIDQRMVHIGSYDTAEEAAWARYWYFKKNGIVYGELAELVADIRKRKPELTGKPDAEAIWAVVFERALCKQPPIVDNDGYRLVAVDIHSAAGWGQIERVRTPLADTPERPDPGATPIPGKKKLGRPRKVLYGKPDSPAPAPVPIGARLAPTPTLPAGATVTVPAPLPEVEVELPSSEELNAQRHEEAPIDLPPPARRGRPPKSPDERAAADALRRFGLVGRKGE